MQTRHPRARIFVNSCLMSVSSPMRWEVGELSKVPRIWSNTTSQMAFYYDIVFILFMYRSTLWTNDESMQCSVRNGRGLCDMIDLRWFGSVAEHMKTRLNHTATAKVSLFCITIYMVYLVIQKWSQIYGRNDGLVSSKAIVFFGRRLTLLCITIYLPQRPM